MAERMPSFSSERGASSFLSINWNWVGKGSGGVSPHAREGGRRRKGRGGTDFVDEEEEVAVRGVDMRC